LGGAGVGGILLGTYFSLKSSATRADMHCTDGHCPASQMETLDRSRHQSAIASWAFGLGGVSLATGVVVYVLAPSRERASTALRVSPVLGTDNAGITASGRF
jgi:hypothetical protein